MPALPELPAHIQAPPVPSRSSAASQSSKTVYSIAPNSYNSNIFNLKSEDEFKKAEISKKNAIKAELDRQVEERRIQKEL